MNLAGIGNWWQFGYAHIISLRHYDNVNLAQNGVQNYVMMMISRLEIELDGANRFNSLRLD